MILSSSDKYLTQRQFPGVEKKTRIDFIYTYTTTVNSDNYIKIRNRGLH